MLLTDLLIQHPSAIVDIVRSTPAWVGALLAALLWLGWTATRERQVHLARMVLMPLAMLALALWGVESAFAASGRLGALLVVWALGYGALLALGPRLPVPAGTRYDAARRSFRVPGSWVPMLLIAAVFLMKYLIGVQLAVGPELAQHAGFAYTVAAVYGLLSGLFGARTLRLVRLMRPLRPALAA